MPLARRRTDVKMPHASQQQHQYLFSGEFVAAGQASLLPLVNRQGSGKVVQVFMITRRAARSRNPVTQADLDASRCDLAVAPLG
jgi:hypothetical protein